MISKKNRRQTFVSWWRAPVARRDRILGAVVGALGCFWMGVLARVLLGPLPISLEALGLWAIGSGSVGAVLGILVPKATICLCFPFSAFGAGN